MPPHSRVLLVEDDRENCLMLKELLEKWGYSVTETFSGEDAVRLARAEPFDIVLTDIRMAGVDGLQVLKAFRETQPRAQVIMMTGFGTIDTAVEAMKAGAFDYLPKPFKFEEVKLALRRALEQQESHGGPAAAPGGEKAVDVFQLVGHSRAMADVYKTIAKVAPGRSTVFLQGESGTGKELVARAIHRHSDRAAKPFVPVNCAALPDTLLESELFGYDRGAHGAPVAGKPGLFEAASGGTLFLDEIGDTSLGLQAKLLRTIADSESRQPGELGGGKTDVRIIASSNKDIPGLIRAGRFRADLHYRLNVVTIHLPPLRERKEDIPSLTEFFIRKYCAAAHKQVEEASPEVLEVFQRYSWPGNVRELENVIERAVILNAKSRIMPEDLPDILLAPPPSASSQSLEEMERQHIVQVLQETKGNVKAAAEILGIDRKTLYRKAAAFGLDILRR